MKKVKKELIIHNLKIEVKYAELYFESKKHWEIRLNDRDFKAGDLIRFHIIGTKNTYVREICNVFSEFGLQENYVIISLSVSKENI